MLDQTFDKLKSYDWGQDPKVLGPIDDAVVATHGDAAARKELEAQLAAVLKGNSPRAAKDYACRKLMQIGTAQSVPTLSALLTDKENTHMARYALERIPSPEAAGALRDALGKVEGSQKIGLLASLGVRGEDASVPAVAKALGDKDPAVAQAAAHALGDIGSPQAAAAVTKAQGQAVKPAATDASLACAEELLSAGKKAEALAIYKRFVSEDQPKHVRLAATRGMLACAGKTQ